MNIKCILFVVMFLMNYLVCPLFANEMDELDVSAKIKNNNNVCVLKGYVSKVPAETKLKIIVETPIDEETSKIDDEIIARTLEDVAINGNVLLPADSTVIGIISDINTAKRLHKSGNIRIDFKSLTTPDGRQIPIVASVLTNSGLLKGKFTKKTAFISSATVVAPVLAGVGAGLAVDGSALGAGVGALLGALAGLGLFAFQRGNMVDIMAGDELTIELTESAVVPSLEDKKSPNDEDFVQ